MTQFGTVCAMNVQSENWAQPRLRVRRLMSRAPRLKPNTAPKKAAVSMMPGEDLGVVRENRANVYARESVQKASRRYMGGEPLWRLCHDSGCKIKEISTVESKSRHSLPPGRYKLVAAWRAEFAWKSGGVVTTPVSSSRPGRHHRPGRLPDWGSAAQLEAARGQFHSLPHRALTRRSNEA